MAGKSNIEWTEATWNPIVGCSILSPGCTNCYAMQMAARIEAMNLEAEARRAPRSAPQYDGVTKKVNGKAVWTGRLALAGENILLQPLKRKKPTIYFVNSMGDLFHEDCPDEWIDHVFAVMALCPQHTFQVLTKRAKRMREYVTSLHNARALAPIVYELVSGCELGPRTMTLVRTLPNVWLGVSTERQQEADERIPELLKTPAAVRFISAEPLLGPIDLRYIAREVINGAHIDNALDGFVSNGHGGYHGPHVDWVIVGGESGSGARPMHPDWARALRDQCAAAGVPYFFKQWGSWIPGAQAAHLSDADLAEYPAVDLVHEGRGNYCFNVGKKKAGRLLDGIEHNGMPEIAR